MAQIDLLSLRESVRDLTGKPDQFRAWLESKHPAEIVGKARCSGACPFVNFLSETFKLEAAFDATPVLLSLPQVGRERRMTIRLEGWLRAFVDAIDRAHMGLKRVRDPITAAEALRVLTLVS